MPGPSMLREYVCSVAGSEAAIRAHQGLALQMPPVPADLQSALVQL